MNYHSLNDRMALRGQTAAQAIFSGQPVLRGIGALDARVKVPLLITVVSLNIVVAQLWLSLLLFLAGFFLAIWSKVRLRSFAFFFLAPAWATLAVFVGFSLGFGQTPVLDIGPFTFYREGMLQGASAAARVACDMAWIAVVFLSTPFNQVLGALRWYRVPRILLDTLATAYRYAFLVCEEFNRMRMAALARGGFSGYLHAFKTVGRIIARIILRAYDRSAAIQASMTARGEEGRPDLQSKTKPETASCPNACDISPTLVPDSVPVLACKGVFFTRGGIRAIENVSLNVAKGEVVFLCGPNGAGKTTLLSLVAGLLMADSGEIHLSGVQLNRKTRKEAYRRVGILAQDPNDQLFCTHVREDVAFGTLKRGLCPAETNRLVDKAMELMEVTELSDRPIHNLSYGEMRRVGLAGLIAMQPPLILLDEPAAGLDPAGTHHLVLLIQHLNKHHGYTFIIVTHDINLAAQLAHRIVILDKGRIVADRPVRDILADTELLQASRLESPLLTTLFRRLFQDKKWTSPVPLTVDEALALLEPIVNGKKLAGDIDPDSKDWEEEIP